MQRIANRFEVKRTLGRGGFGVVYEAHDPTLGKIVALKQLRHFDPSALYRFKQEFRSFAGIVHPNLVRFHELISVEGEWYLSMDLVDGVPFTEYARGRAVEAEDTLDAGARSPPPDDPRLRAGLLQLVDAVVAIHASGKLHRDLKPSNVLVTRDGRVVVLDFGLVANLTPDGVHESVNPGISGTPAYMSPEQAAGEAVTPASDWYAVGVMLYEALTGRVPFSGTLLQVLNEKQQRDPPDPRDRSPGIAGDLAELCLALMSRAPSARPDAEGVRRRLSAPAPVPSLLPSSAELAVFVGRERERALLLSAFEEVRAGKPVLLFVHGQSGMGKSALVRRFLEELARGAVVLEGRCYERESVPYKALDSFVDALAQHLLALPKSEAAALMPRDAAALARLFPVLARAEVMAEAPRRADDTGDPHAARRRAFRALRELLARMSDRTPLVIHLDDLQWGDADSAELIVDLLRPPEAPALLLVASYRSADAESSALLPLLRAEHPDAKEVVVEPLSLPESESLAAALGAPSAAAAAIAREASGSPFFVHELARAAAAGALEGLRLQDVVLQRIARLSPEARVVLERVCVAGHPVIAQALGAEAPEALGLLRAESLVRTRQRGDREEVEVFHDRIRDAVASSLAPEVLRARHLEIAEGLAAFDPGEEEALALHLRLGGEPLRALEHAEKAGRRAVEALAFERAAALYRTAVEIAPPDRVRALKVALGDALANAGRGAEAAKVYLEAKPGAPSAESEDLERRAADQLLRSGRIDEGLALLSSRLEASGIAYPRTAGRAIATMLYRRARLRLRGLGTRERAESQVPAGELEKLDLCWAAGIGLCNTDMVRGMGFLTKHLILALDAGEPSRIVRGLGMESMFTAGGGPEAMPRAQQLGDLAQAMAGRVNDPRAQVWAGFGAAMPPFCAYRWSAADEAFERTLTIVRERGLGFGWEVGTTQFFSLLCDYYLGRLRRMCERGARWIQEAEDRGDLYTSTNLITAVTPIERALAGDPEGGRRALLEAVGRWTQSGIHFQHLHLMLMQASLSLYAGKGQEAADTIQHMWPPLAASGMLRVRVLEVRAREIRGRALLGAAASARGGERTRLLQAALQDARWLESQHLPFPRSLSLILRACAATIEGDRARARTLFGEAAALSDTAETTYTSAILRLRQSELSEGEESTRLRTAALARLEREDTRDIPRIVAMFTPT